MRPDWWDYIADDPSEAETAKVPRCRRDVGKESVAVALSKLGDALTPKLFTLNEIALTTGLNKEVK